MSLNTGEMWALTAGQMGMEPDSVVAAVWVSGSPDGSVGVIATPPLEAMAVISMLASAIERVIAGEIGIASAWQESK